MKLHTHSFFATLAAAFLAASQTAALVPNAWLVAETFRIATIRPSGAADSFGYNALGQNTTHTNSEGNTYAMAYDALGRMTSATNALGVQVFTATYDPSGNLLTRADAEGNTLNHTYDNHFHRVSP